jgi:hypothetical protein
MEGVLNDRHDLRVHTRTRFSDTLIDVNEIQIMAHDRSELGITNMKGRHDLGGHTRKEIPSILGDANEI